MSVHSPSSPMPSSSPAPAPSPCPHDTLSSSPCLISSSLSLSLSFNLLISPQSHFSFLHLSLSQSHLIPSSLLLHNTSGKSNHLVFPLPSTKSVVSPLSMHACKHTHTSKALLHYACTCNVHIHAGSPSWHLSGISPHTHTHFTLPTHVLMHAQT